MNNKTKISNQNKIIEEQKKLKLQYLKELNTENPTLSANTQEALLNAFEKGLQQGALLGFLLKDSKTKKI